MMVDPSLSLTLKTSKLSTPSVHRILIQRKRIMRYIWLTDFNSLPWIGVIIGSILVGLTGVFPLLVIPLGESDDLHQGDKANNLKTLLGFAVGGLLGDIFLHSLPEIWAQDVNRNGGQPSMSTGLLILTGLMLFTVIDKLFSIIKELNTQAKFNNEDDLQEGNRLKNKEENWKNNVKKRDIAGYLNLTANIMDNFTHGLSLGGAFLVSFRLGCLTTLAILTHEIPHEVGDFALLLKSGFSRWEAAKMQLYTASFGIMGAVTSIIFSGATNSLEEGTSWILPFTTGSFLHISLVTILPELLEEKNPRESLKQMSALLFGVAVMGFIAHVFE